MKPLLLPLIFITLVLSGCDNNDNTAPDAATTTAQATQTPTPESASSTTAQETTEQAATATPEPATDKTAETIQAPVASDTHAGEEQPGTIADKESALLLARKSGCLACHAIDKKLVGPPWQDVAARYNGDMALTERLVNKVKQGGKGNWTEITGGAPMPPYSPRVKDADIETLVRFILSLHPR